MNAARTIYFILPYFTLGVRTALGRAVIKQMVTELLYALRAFCGRLPVAIQRNERNPLPIRRE